ATLRTLVAMRLPFAELMERANRLFFSSVGGQQYATLLAGKASPGGDVELANAGHPLPILLRESGAVTIPPTSVPIGLFANAPFATERLTLAVGDDLVVYTDGITEAVDESGREYGSDRLAASVLGHRDLAPPDLVSASMSDVAAFRRGGPRQDD